jgi:hypothetical protein
LTKTANFSFAEIGLGLIIAVIAEVGGLLLLRTGGGTMARADISDERARPMSVSITPILDDAPLLKLGSKRQPGRLPDRWIAPRPVARAQQTATPSTHAQATPSAIPTVAVSDAGLKPPPPNAEITKQTDLSVEVPDAGRAPVSNEEGAADGVKEGTETDPLKAHAVSLYRSQLDRWFSAKFAIRGKIPFETLKTLKGTVVVQIGPDRTVTNFSLTKPSGNATFDEELRSTMANIVASGAELPPPPPMYPDVLGSSQAFSFHCTNRSSCE